MIDSFSPKQREALSRLRILIIYQSSEQAQILLQFLKREGIGKVFIASDTIKGLRNLQDRKVPIDCVFCGGQDLGNSALQFLIDLRKGRWGGATIKEMPVVLHLPDADQRIVRFAKINKATAVIAGPLTGGGVIAALARILEPRNSGAPRNFLKAAYFRVAHEQIILVNVPPRLQPKTNVERDRLCAALAASAANAALSGTIALAWVDLTQSLSFFAPHSIHAFMKTLDAQRFEQSLRFELFIDEDNLHSSDSYGRHVYGKHVTRDGGADESRKDGIQTRTEYRRDVVAADNFKAFTKEDIYKVAEFFKKTSRDYFAERFVKQLAVAQLGPLRHDIVQHEYFVSIAELRKAIFPDANLRECGALFRSLTLLLDQVMIRALPFMNDLLRPFSINLNIETVYSKSFQDALERISPEGFSVEFPQPSLLKNFESFLSAREFLKNRGISTSVDQIYPDTLGLLSFGDTRPDLAKIYWRGQRGEMIGVHRDKIASLADTGIAVVMSRIDSQAAIDYAHDAGITALQGHLIETIIGSPAL